jgi:hypothetical protein
VLAVLSERDLVLVLVRFRLHLVRHRTTLKNRIHATLITLGAPVPGLGTCSGRLATRTRRPAVVGR